MIEKSSTSDELKVSIVVPVFNRPTELKRLLASLALQTFTNFEVVIIEDGSEHPSNEVLNDYTNQLSLKYIVNKRPLGPALARNKGCENASGNFFVFTDSDCFLPKDYFEKVKTVYDKQTFDVFGGPDKGHYSFSILQLAIDYSMTSFLTTGGIRGGRERLDLFYPKGFNMGLSRSVFINSGGFADMRYGEDTELSYRLRKSGFKVRFIEEAFVYHERRKDLKGFARQVYNSGKARVAIFKKHKHALKLLHLMPVIAMASSLMLAVLAIWHFWIIFPLLLYSTMILVHATVKKAHPIVGLLSILTSLVQVYAYGIGFLNEYLIRSTD